MNTSISFVGGEPPHIETNFLTIPNGYHAGESFIKIDFSREEGARTDVTITLNGFDHDAVRQARLLAAKLMETAGRLEKHLTIASEPAKL